MDKAVLTKEDIDLLLAWRDAHKELVRSFPNPLKAIEISFTHNPFRVRGVRNGNLLKLTVTQGYDVLARSDLRYLPTRGLVQEKMKSSLTREDFQAALTVYCSLMALMTYSGAEEWTDGETVQRGPHKAASGHKKQSRKGVTYILRSTGSAPMVLQKGSHASPRGIFTVRGHYRRYKSGKVVWIAEYKKGTGKKKSKTYKVGKDRKNVSDPG